MNKKLLAVAVAGVLAAPTAALAQSSVTISGVFKMSWGNLKIGNAVAARTGNTSETRLTDDSSRIVFNVVEDLGGGLSAIGQFDWRIAPDNGNDGGAIPTALPTVATPAGGGVGGNSHVGLRSKNWGRIFVGRQDLHYFNIESDLTSRGDLKAVSWSLLSFVASGAGIGVVSRTPNVVHYTTPNWGGFTMIAAYSTGMGANEADIGSAVRKGRAINLHPNLEGPNYQIGYSYWSGKPDGSLADQRGDRLYGSYKWGGLKVGLAWDKSRLKNAAGTLVTNRRTAWSLPVGYQTGPHNIFAHYTKARDDKATAAQDGARMWAVTYAYDLSKRTSLGVTYANIRNDVGAAYNLFTSSSAAIGTTGAAAPNGTAPNAGEDPRMWSITVRHAF